MSRRSLVAGVLLVLLGLGLAAPAQAVTEQSSSSVAAQAQEAPPGGLPQPPSGRRRGLPTVLALVALVGVGSLLVRVVFAEAEPEREREPEPPGGLGAGLSPPSDRL